MEFSIFVWIISAFLFIMTSMIVLIGQKIFPYCKLNYLYLIGIFLLILLLFIYSPHSTQIWNSWNEYIYLKLTIYNIPSSQLWKEVWHTMVFFRNIWPSIIVASVMISIENIMHPYTNRYRMIKSFAHNKIHIMMIMLFIYVFLYKTSFEILKLQALNIAIYTAVYYWRFGFATILYILRYGMIRYEIGFLLLIIPIILSGENFLLPLVAIIGIGISDIWMDYHKRDASIQLFSLDFS